ncbi:unnamed protein product [Closterium sp. Naga37s-1]|nr:unnamed protein product [Closterium sp. Naga37s-1]
MIHPGNPDAGNQESKDHPKLPDGGKPLLLEERMVGDSPVAVSETPRGETEATEKDEKDDEEEEKKGKKKEKKPAVPYWRLFSYADRTDVALMAVGTFGAVLHGAALPISFLFLGKMVDSFGTNDLSGVNTVRGVREGRDDGEGMRRAAKCEGAPAVPAGAAAAGGAVWALVFHSSPPLPTPPFLLPLSSFAEVACWMHTGSGSVQGCVGCTCRHCCFIRSNGGYSAFQSSPGLPPSLPLPPPWQRWRAGCTRARGRARGCASCTCNSHFPLFPSPHLSSASPAIPAEVACWMHTGERQSARVRRLYLQLTFPPLPISSSVLRFPCHPRRGGVLDAHGRAAEREGAPAVPATHISPSSHLLLCPPLPLPSPQRWRAGCTRASGRARGCAGCTCNSHFPLFPSPPLSSASPAIPAEVACWMHTGERQSARVRRLYLQLTFPPLPISSSVLRFPCHPRRGGVLDAHGRAAEREGAPAVPATHISPSSHLLLCPPLPLPSPQRWRAGCTRASGRARGCAGCTCNSHFPLFPSPPLSSASPNIPAEVACWMHTGERQSARVRRLYLQALLRQEVAFFDLEACSGELVNRVSSDVLLLQDAISEKVGNCIHYFSTFVCGFIVGFTSVWQLALVILAVCPLIIATGGIYAAVLTGLMTQGEKAYTEAGKIAEQAVGQVPPVQSYVAEDRTVEACGLPHRLATHNLPHHPLFTTPSPPSPPPHQAVGQVRTVQSYVAEDRTVEAYGRALRDTFKLGVKWSEGAMAFESTQKVEDRTVEAYGRALRDTIKLGVKGGSAREWVWALSTPLMFASFALMFWAGQPREWDWALSTPLMFASLALMFWFSALLISLFLYLSLPVFPPTILTTMFAIALRSLGLGQWNPLPLAFPSIPLSLSLFRASRHHPQPPQTVTNQGGLAKGVGLGAIYALMFASFALMFWFSGILISQGIGNGGSILTTMFAIALGSLGLGQALPNVTAFSKGRVAAYKIFVTIARRPVIGGEEEGEGGSGGKELEAVEGRVEFEMVCFAYPARPEVPIFEDFSLSIPAGATVALVGPSGSGKSTVVALIQRFYDPTAGSVSLDGADLRQLSLTWLRSQLGLVSQEPSLFATSILENIRYGKEDATLEEVEEAARIANAHSFVTALPQGYNTQVGERGVQLSGGQKQRIAIARAVVRNPRVLLLDEATSALDSESELVVQAALDSGLMRGRSTVVIAHRLSTIRNADKIAVVAGGRVVEEGTHEELMAHGGLEEGGGGGEDEGRGVGSAKEGARKEGGVYANLVRLQMVSGEDRHVSLNALANQVPGLKAAGRLRIDVDQSGYEEDVGRKISRALSSISASSTPRCFSDPAADVGQSGSVENVGRKLSRALSSLSAASTPRDFREPAADVDQLGSIENVGRKLSRALSSLSAASTPDGFREPAADVEFDLDLMGSDEDEEEGEGGEGGGGKRVWGELRKVLPAPLRALFPGGKKRGEDKGGNSQEGKESGVEEEGAKGDGEGEGEGEGEGVGGKKASWWRLARMSAPEWPFTALGAAGAVMAGAFNPVYALLLIDVIAALYNPVTDEMKREVNKWAIVFTALGVLALPVHSVQNYGFGVSGEALVKRVREKMLAAILGNEVAWFDRDANASGAIASRLATDATLVKAAVADRIALATQNLSVIVIAFVIGFVVEWRVALVVIATFPLLIFAALMEQQFLAGFAGNQNSSHAGATTIAAEAVANIRTVAAFNAQEKILALFTARLAGPLRRSFLRGQVGGAGFGLSQFFMYGSYALALWYGSTLIPNTASYGDVLKSFMVLIMTSMAIAESITLAPDIAKGSVAVRSVFKTTDRTPKIQSDDPTAELVSTVRGKIEFRSVSFAYPTRPETPVLQDLSLRAAPGKMLALVGPSGSGKSSVVALVERFYDPTAGSVRVDGEDIRTVHLKTLRSFIGLVSQEPALFATTIRGNILYGQPGASEAEVVEAARAASMHGFISGLPEGYDTQVGERGVQLSGGQKQRIAIARAILKDPAVLLLDESHPERPGSAAAG